MGRGFRPALVLAALAGVVGCGVGVGQIQGANAIDQNASPIGRDGGASRDVDGAMDPGGARPDGSAGGSTGATPQPMSPGIDAAAAASNDGGSPGPGPLPDAAVAVGPPVVGPWPGTSAVVALDSADQLGMNLSGLAYLVAANGQPAALLAVQNSPSKLHRFTAQGSIWARDPGNSWAAGKTLRYPGGKGAPDAEGVTLAGSPAAAYVVAESDGGESSRLSVLRFDLARTEVSLTATHEWNLTADLPKVDANLGLEAITWVPDEHLIQRGFRDDSTGAAYQPDRYPNHGNGLFLVALEENGTVYAYALDHQTATAHRIASFTTGQETVVDLSYDGDFGVLWADCDDTCNNRITLLAIDTGPASATYGRFVVRHGLNRPPSLPNTNNEGIAFAPVSECQPDGQRRFFWADDSAQDGHALRMGSIPCLPVF